MKTFKSLADLEAAAKKAARKTLDKQIKTLVQDKIRDKQDELVYDSYDPPAWGYQRRYSLGSEFNSFWVGAYTIHLYDTQPAAPSVLGCAAPPPGYLAQWINDGNVPNIFNNNDYPWMHARRFYDEAVQELQGSSELFSVARAGFLANI